MLADESSSEERDDDDLTSKEESDDDSEEDFYTNGILHSDSDDDYDYDSEDDEDVVVESYREILSTLTVVRLVKDHHLNQALRVCGLWWVQL